MSPKHSTNLPALPTSSVPMTFTNNITKEDLANLIIAMEEDKLYKIRDNNKTALAKTQKQLGDDWKHMSDLIINALPKDQKQAAKQFATAVKVLDPKGADVYIFNISINKHRVHGELTNMLPTMFGLAQSGYTSLRISIVCDETDEIKKQMKKIKDTEKLCEELQEQFDSAMHKIQDTHYYERKVRAKVTGALLQNISPAEVLKMYSSGKMFGDEPKASREEFEGLNVR